jgi:hypothetical protein
MMENHSFKFLGKKVIIKAEHTFNQTSEEVINSEEFKAFILKAIQRLKKQDSPLLTIFSNTAITENDIDLLIKTLSFLTRMKWESVSKISEQSNGFFTDLERLNNFVEFLYNYWRDFDRFILCSSTTQEFEKKPYRFFNDTVEKFTHAVRKIYRDIQENITYQHPVIYRQVSSGAEIGAITTLKNTLSLDAPYEQLKDIPVIRQILLYPPLILNPPMNKRTGSFKEIKKNPLEVLNIKSKEWICYPAKVGELLIYVYFHEKFMELGFSLCNLFDLAREEDLKAKPDGIYFFGTSREELESYSDNPTVFFEDNDNDILVAAVPNDDEFGYFGYLKKMILTLHNIKMMKSSYFPFHGAMVKILLKNNASSNILIIGDSGAGKSETLEAFRSLGTDIIKDMIIIADDMGSIKLTDDKKILAYGTEIGAFVRLDDLQPEYALGQIDRTIIMSPGQVNARAILPVTTYSEIMKGHEIDYILYANNYESVDQDHPIIDEMYSKEEALRVFTDGAVMSKGTTTSTGLVHSYFANIFGPPQYKELHDKIADKYFGTFFKDDIFVGQIRTRLGISGFETKGPIEAAKKLMEMVQADHA